MPLKLKRRHGSDNWYIRGTIRGVTVDESTGVADREAAEAIRSKREWEITQGSIVGKRRVATFLEAAVSYLESGGDQRFIKPLLDHFGTTRLDKIDQAAIEAAGRKLYPGVAPSTLNRQLFTPMAAILHHAHKRGLVEHRVIERPKQPPGVVRWLPPDEADQLIAAAAPHLAPLLQFLFGVGCRIGEALWLDWRHVDLARGHVSFVKTKNTEARGVPLHPASSPRSPICRTATERCSASRMASPMSGRSGSTTPAPGQGSRPLSRRLPARRNRELPTA